MLEQFKRVDFGNIAVLAGGLSLIIFTAIFVTVSIRCFILPKSKIDEIANLPLDDGKEDPAPENPQAKS